MREELNNEYWEKRYATSQTQWDTGSVTQPFKTYIDQLTNKSLKILIPGCGNSYEGNYLSQKGFINVYLLDIAKQAIQSARKIIPSLPANQFIQKNFFDHEGNYDLILEQTFFCAINPNLRGDYVRKMYNLLAPKGKLVGVLFDIDKIDGPPFGGTKQEYERLFNNLFTIKKLERCKNSIPPRFGKEFFIILERK